nr:MAG TPA: Single strand binding protein [Bacteriophage sp.]
MLNRQEIIGRICADPELKATDSGKKWTKFSVAVDREYVREGEDKKVDFFTCYAYEGLAEKVIVPYAKKGTLVFCAGSMESNKDREDNTRIYWGLKVRDFKLLSAKGSGSTASAPASSNQSNADSNINNLKPAVVDDDDMPF